MKLVYWNGKIVPATEVLIPFDDPAFLYGEGVFTTLRVHQGVPCFLEHHLERLRTQSILLKLPPHQFQNRIISDLIALNGAVKGDFRLKLIRTERQEIAFIDPYICLAGEPCRLRVEENPNFSTLAALKSLAYLERKKVREKGVQAGFDDSIIVCPQRFWLETGCGNLFWHEQGKFYYPSQTHLYLKGIILTRLIKNYEMVPAEENPRPDAQLYFCNSLHGVRPVIQVDARDYSRNFALEKELLNRVS